MTVSSISAMPYTPGHRGVFASCGRISSLKGGKSLVLTTEGVEEAAVEASGRPAPAAGAERDRQEQEPRQSPGCRARR